MTTGNKIPITIIVMLVFALLTAVFLSSAGSLDTILSKEELDMDDVVFILKEGNEMVLIIDYTLVLDTEMFGAMVVSEAWNGFKRESFIIKEVTDDVVAASQILNNSGAGQDIVIIGKISNPAVSKVEIVFNGTTHYEVNVAEKVGYRLFWYIGDMDMGSYSFIAFDSGGEPLGEGKMIYKASR